jgi:hypothetical protein
VVVVASVVGADDFEPEEHAAVNPKTVHKRERPRPPRPYDVT